MTQKQDIHETSGQISKPDVKHDKKLKFSRCSDFQIELRRVVDELFQDAGRRERDCPQMYTKILILLVSFVSLYGSLVFIVQQWWQALPLAILLGLVIAAIGFNIQHDGGHQACSSSAWVNLLMATTLCGNCVEYCPTNCLSHTGEYELSVYDRHELNYDNVALGRLPYKLTEDPMVTPLRELAYLPKGMIQPRILPPNARRAGLRQKKF